MGPNGEVLLLAITSRHQLACEPVLVAEGASRVERADALWDLLEEVDPLDPRRRLLRVV